MRREKIQKVRHMDKHSKGNKKIETDAEKEHVKDAE